MGFDLGHAFQVYQNLGGLVRIFLGILVAALIGTLVWYVFSEDKRAWRWHYRTILVSVVTLGFALLLVGYLHLAIYLALPLELPPKLAPMINHWLKTMGHGVLPPYRPEAPPRFLLPPWLEREKFLFWFSGYAVMAIWACRGVSFRFTRATLSALLSLQLLILLFINPFTDPLPRFFEEIRPWTMPLSLMERARLFARLYPRMVFFYNAHYMWVHPPLLFLSYAALTVFFVACLSMLVIKRPELDQMAYRFARPGYIALTMGMLLGFPWALKAWGPNWWWDPKIASSIMMWLVFSTYFHARLYLTRRGMWSFVSWLGIICFVAMLYTFAASYLFPGEHTVH